MVGRGSSRITTKLGDRNRESGDKALAKKKKELWCGYLEAGERSSPVVRDGSIETGKASTIYLFNWAKGKILEYQRDIVEAKLRELSGSETTLVPELEDAYRRARTGFTPRGTARPKTARPKQTPPPEPDYGEMDDESDDAAWAVLDDDSIEPSPAEFVD